MTDQTEASGAHDTAPDPTGAAARADLIAAIMLTGLGIAVAWNAYGMDRLEARRINPFTVPGLVPFILGLALSGLGLLLALRSWRLSVPGAGAALFRAVLSWSAVRVMAVLALALAFTLGLVGWLPFWLASSLFVFGFILLFETVLADAPTPLPRALFWALAVGFGTGLGVSYVFGDIFLVRLP